MFMLFIHDLILAHVVFDCLHLHNIVYTLSTILNRIIIAVCILYIIALLLVDSITQYSIDHAYTVHVHVH